MYDKNVYNLFLDAECDIDKPCPSGKKCVNEKCFDEGNRL